MSRFAKYYFKFDGSFGPHEWNERQQCFSDLFEKDGGIEFFKEKDEKRTALKHQFYRLDCAREIIVMRIANNVNIPLERDFKPTKTTDEPSCFVIIDNRDNLRTMFFHKRKKAFASTEDLAKILAKSFNERLYKEHCFGFEILPEYYPEDLYEAWETLQMHLQSLRFGVPDMEPDKIMERVEELRLKGSEYFDDSLMVAIIQIALKAKEAKYKHIYTLFPEDKKTALYVDKTSSFVRNLVTFAEATGQPVELVTQEGSIFRCYVNSKYDNTDRIINYDINEELLNILFDEKDKQNNEITPEQRRKAEGEVLEMMNTMKHEVGDEENVEAVA